LDIEFPVTGKALPDVEVDGPLVGNVGILGHLLEVLDHIEGTLRLSCLLNRLA